MSLGAKKKAVHYFSDGTGRDSYIQNDNGGTNITYKCQGVPEYGNFMKFGNSHKTSKSSSTTPAKKNKWWWNNLIKSWGGGYLKIVKGLCLPTMELRYLGAIV